MPTRFTRSTGDPELLEYTHPHALARPLPYHLFPLLNICACLPVLLAASCASLPTPPSEQPRFQSKHSMHLLDTVQSRDFVDETVHDTNRLLTIEEITFPDRCEWGVYAPHMGEREGFVCLSLSEQTSISSWRAHVVSHLTVEEARALSDELQKAASRAEQVMKDK